MSEFRVWFFVVRICFAFTALSVDLAWGADAIQQRAIAAIEVARVQVQITSERPKLPDSANRFNQLEQRSKAETNDTMKGLSMSVSANDTLATLVEVPAAQLVIGGWVEGCPACRRLERDIKQILDPLGWKIGHGVTDQIRFVELPNSESVPRIVLFQNGVELKRWNGYRDPAFLSNELRSAWDQAPSLRLADAVGQGGTIHARSRIRQMLTWFHDNIGEGVKAELRWDRSGAQSFPLLAKGDWSAMALFGGYGHMQLSASGAKNLPIQSLGFGYRVDGEDITFDVDPVTMKGLASLLGQESVKNDAKSQAGYAPSSPVPEAGLVTIWSVFSIVRDIWSLLHPSCDLQLGGNLSATAVISGNALTVDFHHCPSIRLVALFTFNLVVKRVVITASNVHVDFSGSRIVQSRDFGVD